MEKFICPVCGKLYEGYPALSRRDNTTKICSQCGLDEAWKDYISAEAEKRLPESNKPGDKDHE